MKRKLAWVLGTGLVVIVAVAATETGAQTKSGDALPPVQPPPDIDAPAPKAASGQAQAPLVPLGNSEAEAKAAAEAEAKASAERAKALHSSNFIVTPTAKPAESPGLPADVQKAAEATELPVITVRQNGTERVEEYRKKGVLYFVRVVPQEGPPRYYVDRKSNIPPDLRHLSGPSGVIEPVYFKLFEWK